jgi:thiol-disulfide isomerase/thioredoxin
MRYFLDFFIHPVRYFRTVKDRLRLFHLIVIYFAVSMVEVYQTAPPTSKVLSQFGKVLPWFGTMNGLFFLFSLMPLLFILIESLSFHWAARLIGGKGSWKILLSNLLLLFIISGILKAIPVEITILTKTEALRVWISVFFGIWNVVLTISLISAIYEFSLGKAIASQLISLVFSLLMWLCLVIPFGFLFASKNGINADKNTLRSPDLNVAKAVADYHWSMTDLEGKTHSFQEFQGKVIFLNFWATWCGPCRAEMPSIQKLYNQLETQGVQFVCVSDEPIEKVKKLVEKNGYTFPIYTTNEKLPAIFKHSSIPITFIIGKDGTIEAKQVGAVRWESEEAVQFLTHLIEK